MGVCRSQTTTFFPRPYGPERLLAKQWEWEKVRQELRADTLEKQAKYVVEGVEDELIGIFDLETQETKGKSPHRRRAKGLTVKKMQAGYATRSSVRESTRSQALRKIRDDLCTLREYITADAETRPGERHGR